MRAPTTGVVFAAFAAIGGLLAAPAGATFPGKNGRIAYVQNRFFWTEGGSDEGPQLDSFPHVFTVNADGSAPRRFAGYAEEPRFSPGGGLVAYQDYLWRIWIKPMSSVAGHESLLVPKLRSELMYYPAWSPSGHRLIFSYELDDGLILHTVGADGTRMHRLRLGFQSDWSIRNRIVFEGPERVATMAPGGGHLRRLRAGGSPRWSPDGRRIVFSRSLPRDRVGIAIMRADGSHPRLLTQGPWDGSAVWSPDGKYIAYVHRNREKAREKILVMRTNGKGRRTVLKVRRRSHLEDFDPVLEDLDWQPLP
jgi:dipeptidyl aminopeptidase/acylaminoacyl peptidase